MRRLILLLIIFTSSLYALAQSPCASNPAYRQFDFWLGEWEVFARNGNKAGESKISLILDSCIILEEWTSANLSRGIVYKGKSFNTYNARTGEWQQTWVDNVGGSTEYLKGKAQLNLVVFETHPFRFSADTMAVRRLSFHSLGTNKVRQHGEITKDGGLTWATEYDLEYRRKS